MFEEWLEINVKEDKNVINTVIKPSQKYKKNSDSAHQLIKMIKTKIL